MGEGVNKEIVERMDFNQAGSFGKCVDKVPQPKYIVHNRNGVVFEYALTDREVCLIKRLNSSFESINLDLLDFVEVENL